MEAYIATLTNSIDLLNTAIEKEEALLAQERKELQEIEKNAKDARAEKGRQMKNVRTYCLPVHDYGHTADM